jgi:acetyltransferase-like isoleucine patch superfamily enzyme
MTAVAALPPTRPTLRHRLRARRAAGLEGVTVQGTPLIGRGVVLDVGAGARLVLGDHCVLLDDCRLHARGGEVRIGERALLGERCVVHCHERVEIGREAVLADGVAVTDFAHGHADVERPIRGQPLQSAAIVVGEGARVGIGAVLQPGAQVPANAVVPPNTVVGGR